MRFVPSDCRAYWIQACVGCIALVVILIFGNVIIAGGEKNLPLVIALILTGVAIEVFLFSVFWRWFARLKRNQFLSVFTFLSPVIPFLILLYFGKSES